MYWLTIIWLYNKCLWLPIINQTLQSVWELKMEWSISLVELSKAEETSTYASVLTEHHLQQNSLHTRRNKLGIVFKGEEETEKRRVCRRFSVHRREIVGVVKNNCNGFEASWHNEASAGRTPCSSVWGSFVTEEIKKH